MGVNYGQYCIIGVSLCREDCEKINSEAVFEGQKRYDTKTGKVCKIEKVLVKEEDVEYSAFGITEDGWWKLYNALGEEFPHLDLVYVKDDILLGKKAGVTYDCGRVELLSGEVSIRQILQDAEEVKAALGDVEIGLHFETSPDESVLDDDDLLDGWIIKQRRQRDKARKSKSLENNKLIGKHKNAVG